MTLEIIWSVLPFLLTMGMFVWGTVMFFRNYDPPDGAMEIYVTGKQWMWKIQHPEGHREINELHIPVGKPIKIVLRSKDVIHDFFVPQFRARMNVVPGLVTYFWFTPTKTGTFEILCAQLCGVGHYAMRGTLIVDDQSTFDGWLNMQRTFASAAASAR